MNIYRIEDFGAVSDGKTINTGIIQKAIDTCHEEGGGKVLCGSGVFRTGTLTLRSNVELHIPAGCKILGSENPDDYEDLTGSGFKSEAAPERSSNCLIRAAESENVAITGAGEINGSGLAFYDASSVNPYGKLARHLTPRPRIIMFYRCHNVLFQDTTYVDSPCWTFWLMQCENVNVHRLKIRGDRRMTNVDGIDIDACRNVTVGDCIMDTEDDCIVLRAIQGMYDIPAVCENITVSNCILDSRCQGIRIGCPGDGVIRNATFSNLVIRSDSNNGIKIENPRIYLPEGSTGSADIHDIVFSSITVNCRRYPIYIYVEEGVRLKRLSDFTFSNFTINSGGPCVVQGSRETIIKNISFNNIKIETSGEDAVVCRQCEDVKFSNVAFSNKVAGK